MKLSVLIPSANEPVEQVETLVKEIEFACKPHQIIVSRDPNRNGKGWALREALSNATGDYIAFIDADGDINPLMFWRLIHLCADFDVIVGTKNLSNVPFLRKILTIASRLYIKIMFGLPCDTQTGIKIFKREFLTTWSTDGFAFDIEVLCKAKKAGARIIEVPVEAKITKGKSWKTVLQTLMDSIVIRIFRS